MTVPDAQLQAARDALRAGRVVAHATETCYGFACDLANPQAVARLFALKRRPTDKPVSALFASLDEARRYVVWNERAAELARLHLPGPLTLILPMRTNAPAQLYPTPRREQWTENREQSENSSALSAHRSLSTVHSVGIRISSHPFASALAAAYGSPISTTSANLHGAANPYSLADIRAQFGEQELDDVVLIDGGKLPPTPPSTVIDLTTDEPLTRRQGERLA